MVFFYRNYPCAPKATLISGLANGFGYIAAIFTIVLATNIPKRPIYILPVLLLAGLAAFLIIYVGHKLTDKLGPAEAEKNITTKPRFAQAFCSIHPEEYDRLAQINPEFGRLYEKNDKGRVVKRKNV